MSLRLQINLCQINNLQIKLINQLLEKINDVELIYHLKTICLFKKWLKVNHIEMYSTYNEAKSVVAERFIRIQKDKIYSHMTAVSKNIFLNDITDKYNNIYHKTINKKSRELNLIFMQNTMLILMKKMLNFKLVIM